MYIYWNQWSINRNATYGNLAITLPALIGSIKSRMCWPSKRRLLQNLSLCLPLVPSLTASTRAEGCEYRVLSTEYSTSQCLPAPLPPSPLVISKIACINALNVNEWVTSRSYCWWCCGTCSSFSVFLLIVPPLLQSSSLASEVLSRSVACFISRRWNMPTSVVVVLLLLLLAALSGHDSLQALLPTGLLQHKSRPSMQHKTSNKMAEEESKREIAQKKLN